MDAGTCCKYIWHGLLSLRFSAPPALYAHWHRCRHRITRSWEPWQYRPVVNPLGTPRPFSRQTSLECVSEDSNRRTTKWQHPYSPRPPVPFSNLRTLCGICTGKNIPFCMLLNCCYEVNFHFRRRMWWSATYQYSTYIRSILCMAITAEGFRMVANHTARTLTPGGHCVLLPRYYNRRVPTLVTVDKLLWQARTWAYRRKSG